MNSFLINLKEKGRKSFSVLCATSCPDLSLTERRCKDAKIRIFYNHGCETDITKLISIGQYKLMS